jgi:hypothetical protein
MYTPGFTAEAALHQISGHYRVARAFDQVQGIILQHLFPPGYRYALSCHQDSITGNCVREC